MACSFSVVRWVTGIEPPQPVQRVAEKVQPDRAGIARREDVDDAAPDRIIAGFRHGRDRRKAHAGQEGFQMRLIHPRRPRAAENEAPRITSRAGRRWVAPRSAWSAARKAPAAVGKRRQRRHPAGGRFPGWVRRGHKAGNPRPGNPAPIPRRHDGKGRAHRLHPLVVAGDVHRPDGRAQPRGHKTGRQTLRARRPG